MSNLAERTKKDRVDISTIAAYLFKRHTPAPQKSLGPHYLSYPPPWKPDLRHHARPRRLQLVRCWISRTATAEISRCRKEEHRRVPSSHHYLCQCLLTGINSMLAGVIEPRISSKGVSKHLTDVRGSPHTQYKRRLWQKRLLEYRKSALRQNVEDPAGPSGETLERFLTTIIPLLKSKCHTSLVPGYSTSQGSIILLAESLVFRYKKFTLSAYERMRLKNWLDKHLKDKLLTKDPSQVKQWFGAIPVQKIAMGMFNDALNDGCINWDVVLMTVTMIVLCAGRMAFYLDHYAASDVVCIYLSEPTY